MKSKNRDRGTDEEETAKI